MALGNKYFPDLPKLIFSIIDLPVMHTPLICFALCPLSTTHPPLLPRLRLLPPGSPLSFPLVLPPRRNLSTPNPLTINHKSPAGEQTPWFSDTLPQETSTATLPHQQTQQENTSHPQGQEY